jgi:hypothetical protein
VIRKLAEVRPPDCIYGLRVGDLVQKDGKFFLQIKCHQCTKRKGETVFHYVQMNDPGELR